MQIISQIYSMRRERGIFFLGEACPLYKLSTSIMTMSPACRHLKTCTGRTLLFRIWSSRQTHTARDFEAFGFSETQRPETIVSSNTSSFELLLFRRDTWFKKRWQERKFIHLFPCAYASFHTYEVLGRSFSSCCKTTERVTCKNIASYFCNPELAHTFPMDSIYFTYPDSLTSKGASHCWKCHNTRARGHMLSSSVSFCTTRPQ
jgi:hypothetical protein